jgi:uncharacterized protein
MSQRNSVPAGAPCWVDLMSSDTARSRDFYGELFGWKAEQASDEFGGYFMFTKDGVFVAGAMPTPPGVDQPDGWGVYLAVEDARKVVERAQAQGAVIRAEVMKVADLGTQAVIEDPGGARIGLWQAETFTGFGSQGQPGTPSWFELHASDYPGAVTFYRDVIGWDTYTASDTPEFRYTTLGREDAARAGIMDVAGLLPDGVGGRWVVYFGVADADVALTRISALGGTVVETAEDTPHGRLAAAADPNGAYFKLVAPNEAMPARPTPS